MLLSIIKGCGLFQICGDIGIIGVCFHSRWKKYLSLFSAVWYITVNVERTSSINHLSLHLKDRDRQSAGFLSVTRQTLATLQWRRFVSLQSVFSETLWGNVMFISSQTFSPRDKSQNRGEQSKGCERLHGCNRKVIQVGWSSAPQSCSQVAGCDTPGLRPGPSHPDWSPERGPLVGTFPSLSHSAQTPYSYSLPSSWETQRDRKWSEQSTSTWV